MLRFSVLGIPVEIKPSFWLVALLIAPFPISSAFSFRTFPFLFAWVAIVGVSVLAHEGGHALVARLFGAEASVTLYAVGGYTTWQTADAIGPWRRTLIAAAGSAVGFVLGGLVWWFGPSTMPPVPSPGEFALVSFWQVNLLWGVLNWLPIRPLDGGHIFVGVLEGMLGSKGVRVADVLFPLTTLAGALYAFQRGLVLLGALALFLLVGEFRRWRPGGQPVPAGPLFGPDDRREAPPAAEAGTDGTSIRHDGNEDS